MLKVMLIEDDATMASLLTTLLNLEGFLVKTPRNHHMEGLLNAILDERPQIAFVDVNLRVGSGLDLVREIRREPEIKDTRILMASGLNLKKECIQAGADSFILKPFMPDDLIKLIHRTIQQKL
jgi:two-component system phosphate regulon response regulator PhoB